jgi:hypothetical protein
MADGTCVLNKYDYIPGETALFECACTSPQEENRAGFIVWKNSTGDILEATATNSNACRTSFFGDNYEFDVNANFTGNVTFSLNADGSGIPTSWDDAADVRNDTFNVSGASALDCIIEFEGPDEPIYNLGKFASISIELKDGQTDDYLVEATCTFHLEDVNDVHIFSEPYGSDIYGIKTIAAGEGTFQQQFNVDTATPNTTYIGKVYCHCSPNTTLNQCYLDKVGTVAGYKSCVSDILLSTSADDFRIQDKDYLPLTIVLIGLLIVLIIFSFYVDSFIYNFEYTKKGELRNMELPLGKLFIWSICLWLLAPLVNIAIIANETALLGLTRTLSAVYRAVIVVDYVVIAFWFIFILYWILSKMVDMGKVNKK